MERAEALVALVIFAIVIIRIVVNTLVSSSRRKKNASDSAGPERLAARNGNAKSKPPVNRKQAVKPNRPSQGDRLAKPNRPARGERLAKPNRPARGTRTARPNQPSDGSSAPIPNVPYRQEELPLEERLAAYKTARAQNRSDSVKPKKTTDRAKSSQNAILEAARENTMEVEQDNDLDAVVTENLLDSVYEVMVKGPNDTLTFQRDFVAEGMEMLNQMTYVSGGNL